MRQKYDAASNREMEKRREKKCDEVFFSFNSSHFSDTRSIILLRGLFLVYAAKVSVEQLYRMDYLKIISLDLLWEREQEMDAMLGPHWCVSLISPYPD